jgi:hypothetical protein
VIKPGLDLVTYSILATIDMEGLILGLSWVHKRPIFSNRRASLVNVSKPERIAEISDDLNQSLRSDSTSTSGILKLAILKV